MTILVAVADSLGFRGSIMAIYLYKNKQNHFVHLVPEKFNKEFQRCFNGQGYPSSGKQVKDFAYIEVAQNDNLWYSLRNQVS